MSDGPSLLKNIQREKDGEGRRQTPCERAQELLCGARLPNSMATPKISPMLLFAFHFVLNKCRPCEKQPKGMFALLLQAWSAPNQGERGFAVCSQPSRSS